MRTNKRSGWEEQGPNLFKGTFCSAHSEMNATFLSQGLLGKREFLTQTECLRRLIVPLCSHLAFAKLCRNVFSSVEGYNMNYVDMVCSALTSLNNSLSFCSQNLPPILYNEARTQHFLHNTAGNSSSTRQCYPLFASALAGQHGLSPHKNTQHHLYNPQLPQDFQINHLLWEEDCWLST